MSSGANRRRRPAITAVHGGTIRAAVKASGGLDISVRFPRRHNTDSPTHRPP